MLPIFVRINTTRLWAAWYTTECKRQYSLKMIIPVYVDRLIAIKIPFENLDYTEIRTTFAFQHCFHFNHMTNR